MQFRKNYLNSIPRPFLGVGRIKVTKLMEVFEVEDLPLWMVFQKKIGHHQERAAIIHRWQSPTSKTSVKM